MKHYDDDTQNNYSQIELGLFNILLSFPKLTPTS